MWESSKFGNFQSSRSNFGAKYRLELNLPEKDFLIWICITIRREILIANFLFSIISLKAYLVKMCPTFWQYLRPSLKISKSLFKEIHFSIIIYWIAIAIPHLQDNLYITLTVLQTSNLRSDKTYSSNTLAKRQCSRM